MLISGEYRKHSLAICSGCFVPVTFPSIPPGYPLAVEPVFGLASGEPSFCSVLIDDTRLSDTNKSIVALFPELSIHTLAGTSTKKKRE